MANTTEVRILEKIKHRANVGGCGSILIDDTSEHDGPFSAFTALADATVDHDACTTNIEDVAEFTVPKGVTLFGDFTSLQFTSATTVIAYYRCD